MYCTVLFSFQSSTRPYKKAFTYKVGENKVRVNDIVEVNYRNNIGYGVVVNIFETDFKKNPALKRISINHVLHTNTVYALVRQRFNAFKNVEFGKTEKTGRRLINKLKNIYGEDYHKQILKFICLGNLQKCKNNNILIRYDNCILTFIKTEEGVHKLQAFQKYDDSRVFWKTPEKPEIYFDKLYNN